MSDRAAWVSLVGAACLALLASRSAPGAMPDPGAVVRYAAACTDGTWKRVAGPAPNLSSRELFTSALALAEAGRDLDRLETLFDLGARMQDRDPESRGYGNFRWSWSHERVLDYNAVEFCMQGGAGMASPPRPPARRGSRPPPRGPSTSPPRAASATASAPPTPTSP